MTTESDVIARIEGLENDSPDVAEARGWARHRAAVLRILREATGEDGLREDPHRRETLVEYDADNRWLIENDGFGASQIIARDVAPNVGRWLARRLAATPEAHRE